MRLGLWMHEGSADLCSGFKLGSAISAPRCCDRRGSSSCSLQAHQ